MSIPVPPSASNTPNSTLALFSTLDHSCALSSTPESVPRQCPHCDASVHQQVPLSPLASAIIDHLLFIEACLQEIKRLIEEEAL